MCIFLMSKANEVNEANEVSKANEANEMNVSFKLGLEVVNIVNVGLFRTFTSFITNETWNIKKHINFIHYNLN